MREYQNTAREKKDEISLEGKHTGDGNPSTTAPVMQAQNR